MAIELEKLVKSLQARVRWLVDALEQAEVAHDLAMAGMRRDLVPVPKNALVA